MMRPDFHNLCLEAKNVLARFASLLRLFQIRAPLNSKLFCPEDVLDVIWSLAAFTRGRLNFWPAKYFASKPSRFHETCLTDSMFGRLADLHSGHLWEPVKFVSGLV